MKLHFISTKDFSSQQLAASLAVDHEISSGPESVDDSYDGMVVGVDSEVNDDQVASAKEVGVRVFSIPELLYHLCEDKQRIVITGTHGKAAVASCIIHVLNAVNKEVDYFIGKPIAGQAASVHISDAPVIIIEGSANRCSGSDTTPQFLRFNHHMALITQLSHEYKELYSSFDEYVKQFDQLADATPKGGTVMYCEEDHLVTVIGGKERDGVRSIPYSSHLGEISDGTTTLNHSKGKISIETSGDHDLQNIGGAFALLKRLNVTEDQFYKAMKTYKPK